MKLEIIKSKSIEEFIAWPIWTCDVSRFDWEYDQEEHCFIIDGKVTVFVGDNSYEVCKGDYVIFPKGLKCIWKVHEPIKKHYSFK